MIICHIPLMITSKSWIWNLRNKGIFRFDNSGGISNQNGYTCFLPVLCQVTVVQTGSTDDFDWCILHLNLNILLPHPPKRVSNLFGIFRYFRLKQFKFQQEVFPEISRLVELNSLVGLFDRPLNLCGGWDYYSFYFVDKIYLIRKVISEKQLSISINS